MTRLLSLASSCYPQRPSRWYRQVTVAGYADSVQCAFRALSSTPSHSQKDKDDSPPSSLDSTSAVKNAPPPTGDLGPIEIANKSMGQVIFLGSPASGGVIFASLALGDPKLAAYAALGTITANTTSRIIGLDRDTWNNGLWGYNGALVGCAASVFGPAYYPYSVLSTLIGAAATPLVSASLRSVLSQPQWTWSFNIVALTSLLRTRPLLPSTNEHDVSTTHTTGFEDVQRLFETLETSLNSVTAGVEPVILSPLTGISQIFVVNSPLTGAGIVAATAMYSPMLALHAVGGCATGSLVGYLLGADISAISDGLWGYNSCLAAMAVGVFFVNSPQTIVLSATSAAASAALFGAMGPIFGAYGVPCLTLPFCTVATASYLLAGHIPGLKLAKDPHSPEKNV